MAFNTMTFMLFFTIVLVFFYIVPKRFRWVFLLISSYAFYMYASVKFLAFILITTISSYFAAICIDSLHSDEKEISKDLSPQERKAQKNKLKKKRKFLLVGLLVLNFGILFVLKYMNFISENLNELFISLSYSGRIPTFNLILPLGISFYTFQTMSYVIDVYWGKIKAERNFGKVALFVSFFPQIIEGPIGRFKDLAPQLNCQEKASIDNVIKGVQLMMWGYFKKIVIADRVAIVADYVFGHYLDISGFGVAIGVFLYAIQDYTDFSGAIDIARGVAKSMGIDMAENFRRPYFSKTIPEFWRRWHMSLGSWMKDYVFYPISLTKGMRKLGKYTKKHCGKFIGKTLPVAFGNIVVFFLVGVWHGANWNYIVWGLFYGFLIAISSFCKPLFDKMIVILHINVKSKIYILFQILRTFWLTCIGCIIFRADNLIIAWNMFLKTFQAFDFPADFITQFKSFGLNGKNYLILVVCLIILFIVDIMQEHMEVRTWLSQRFFIIRWIIYLFGIIIILLFGIYGPGMSPSQFVYMQF